MLKGILFATCTGVCVLYGGDYYDKSFVRRHPKKEGGCVYVCVTTTFPSPPPRKRKQKKKKSCILKQYFYLFVFPFPTTPKLANNLFLNHLPKHGSF